MAEDLAVFAEDGLVAARAIPMEVAVQLRDAARSLSSPYYGVSVATAVAPTQSGARVVARVVTHPSPGAVYGGDAAVRREVERKWREVASGAGLD